MVWMPYNNLARRRRVFRHLVHLLSVKEVSFMDKDLVFLSCCSNQELEFLFQIITTKGSLTEFVTTSKEYKKYGKDYQRYTALLANEILDFGSNTFWFQKTYHDVAKDACRKAGVDCQSSDSTETIEMKLLSSLMNRAWKSMTEEQQKKFIECSGNHGRAVYDVLGRIGSSAFYTLCRNSGLFSYHMTYLIANELSYLVLKRGLSFSANVTLLKTVASLTGPISPIGWIITGVWTIADIAGPAYRVTVPAVAWIGCLRNIKKYQH